MTFAEFVREEAALIDADGCTGITNWNAECCLAHDLEFYYGRSVTDAYRRYRDADAAYTHWTTAAPVTFEQANSHFKACNFRSSKAGYFNPFAWVRWLGMKLRKTRASWEQHRQREREA